MSTDDGERAAHAHVWKLVFVCAHAWSASDVARVRGVSRLWRALVVYVPVRLDLMRRGDTWLLRDWLGSHPSVVRNIVALRNVGERSLTLRRGLIANDRPSILDRLGFRNNFRPDRRAPTADPVHLERISFDDYFDHSIHFLGAVRGLVEIRLGASFSRGIETSNLPRGLRVLHTGRSFDHSFATRGLPDTLIVLKFGACFRQGIDEWGLPRGLRVLAFGREMARPIDAHGLPPALRKLRVGYCRTVPIDARALPQCLVKLRVPLCNVLGVDVRGATYDLVVDVCDGRQHYERSFMSCVVWLVFPIAFVGFRNAHSIVQLMFATTCAVAYAAFLMSVAFVHGG